MSAPIIRELSSHVRFLNADDRTLEKLQSEGWSSFAVVPIQRLREIFIEAANEVFAETECALARDEAVGSETVLSTDKYRPLVERALAAAGAFFLIYVGLRDARISEERVALRVARGGHDVPSDRLEARWKRSVENLGWYARRAKGFFVFDNSASIPGEPPRLIAEGGAGLLTIHDSGAIPQITASLTAAFFTEP